MISYSYGYSHKTKEVVLQLTLGGSTLKTQMSAEALIHDIAYISKDPKLAHFLSVVRERKDFPIDHDFGPGGEEIKFNPEDWEGKMG